MLLQQSLRSPPPEGNNPRRELDRKRMAGNTTTTGGGPPFKKRATEPAYPHQQLSNDAAHVEEARGQPQRCFVSTSQHQAATNASVAISHDAAPESSSAAAVEGRTPSAAADDNASTAAPVLNVGVDCVAHILSFLEPRQSLTVLTTAWCRDWHIRYTNQPCLWRMLCQLEPFRAQQLETTRDETLGDENAIVGLGTLHDDQSDDASLSYNEESDDDSSTISSYYYGESCDGEECHLHHDEDDILLPPRPALLRQLLASGSSDDKDDDGIHWRILYTQLVRYTKYLERIRERARTWEEQQTRSPTTRAAAAAAAAIIITSNPNNNNNAALLNTAAPLAVVTTTTTTPHSCSPPPSSNDEDDAVAWSGAVHAIARGMALFAHIPGMVTMCLQVLPRVMEDESQRKTAQHSGLIHELLLAMERYPHELALHTAALYSIALLSRPLGGREGMVVQPPPTPAVAAADGVVSTNAEDIFAFDVAGNHQGRQKSCAPAADIGVILDSMRRFQSHASLQVMGCWSLVNIALMPSQKGKLIALGGVQVTVNAMRTHPNHEGVQYRALFALINLVNPFSANAVVSSYTNVRNPVLVSDRMRESTAGHSQSKGIIDAKVDQIVNLVVASMKGFYYNRDILNRACLVLHNLSLSNDYHRSLLCATNCYQMLQWCICDIANVGDDVLQLSAGTTLQRLQQSLSRDGTIRKIFLESLQSQHKLSMKEALVRASIVHERGAAQSSPPEERRRED